MWRKRALLFVCIYLICFAVLLGRLMQLQLFETRDFSKHKINLLEESVQQRSQEIVIDSGRGGFLDKNGDSLTHQTLPVLVLFPFLKKMEWDVQKIANIIGDSSHNILKAVELSDEPFVYGKSDPYSLSAQQMKKINELKIPGVFAVEKKFEIVKNPAEHLIGITGENEKLLKSRYPDKNIPHNTLIGLTGMEKSFDEFLLPEGKAKLVYHVDASGGPLFGINVKYVEPANPFYPINIRTTIDADIQQKAETLVKQHGVEKGGLVLLDIETNSILAMVSHPEINRKDPFNKETGGVQNLMFKEQITGSVFKTVVAAAAIENQLDDPTRLFDCSSTIMGEPDPKYQYGNLNVVDSFAKSCNNTFATLAEELQEKDPNTLEDFARKLSLIGPTGWVGDIYHYDQFKQIPEEDKGRVFLTDEARKDRNFSRLTGIGQHEVRATPLAIANMMATIARGGEKEMVRIASTIEYKNGTTLLDFKENKIEGDTISPYTAMKLQRLLREVVVHQEGTGRGYQGLPYEIAGKSGTAETGKYINDSQLHNKWFAGYFPYKNPKYALVVVNLDVYGNGGSVTPLFSDLVKAIYEKDQEE